MADKRPTGLDRVREAIRKDRGDNPTEEELKATIDWLNSISCCRMPDDTLRYEGTCEHCGRDIGSGHEQSCPYGRADRG